ncbi:MAG: hypothetical protein O3A00_08415 [Planctomycetota bacterium]|nr:hypothetical protein [Planctomycetota bacterium]
MTLLKLFAPPLDSPATIPFPNQDLPAIPLPLPHRRGSAMSVLQRSRTIFENRICPDCRQASVSTIELADGLRDAWSFTIPGTASLVGFHCKHCGSEWAAR